MRVEVWMEALLHSTRRELYLSEGWRGRLLGDLINLRKESCEPVTASMRAASKESKTYMYVYTMVFVQYFYIAPETPP